MNDDTLKRRLDKSIRVRMTKLIKSPKFTGKIIDEFHTGGVTGCVVETYRKMKKIPLQEAVEDIPPSNFDGDIILTCENSRVVRRRILETVKGY